MKKCFFLLTFVLIGQLTWAQNFTYPTMEVLELSFHFDNTIRLDDGTGDYSAPHWESAAVIQDPVAYASGESATISADLKMTCSQAPDSVWVRAWGPDSIAFASHKLGLSSIGGGEYLLSYPMTIASYIFPAGVVGHYDPFKIDWELSFDGINFRAAMSTENELYVSMDEPMVETSRFKWFHSVYDISCRNAVGKDTDTGVIAAVWKEFLDHAVLSWDGDSLHYYETFTTFNTNLAALLKYKNAQCYTFAQLFLSLMKIQGVVRTNNYVFITPKTNYECGYSVNRFIVKNWVFDTASSASFCPDYPYKNTYTTLVPPPYDAYNFIQEDVRDSTGLFGVGSDNPASYFNNHQITYIDGVYYDPCYGVTFNSIADIPAKAFSGWGFRFTSSGVTNAYFTNDMSQTELRSSVSTF